MPYKKISEATQPLAQVQAQAPALALALALAQAQAQALALAPTQAPALALAVALAQAQVTTANLDRVPRKVKQPEAPRQELTQRLSQRATKTRT